jgi:hypothetical protein
MPDRPKGILSRAVTMDSQGPLGYGPHYTRTPGTVGVGDDLDPTMPHDEKKKATLPSEKVSANRATLGNLESMLEQSVETFCGKYGSLRDDFNHCAHFVSHVIGLRIPGAALCSNVAGSKYTFKERREGYCIRVNQVFNSCSNRAYWDDGASEGTCLVVATVAANIESKSPLTIGEMSRKHIGFHIAGVAYHYSNTRDKVVKQTIAEFKRHYGNDTILLRADLP